MQSRMPNPALVVPDAMQALHALGASAEERGGPSRTPGLSTCGRARSMAAAEGLDWSAIGQLAARDAGLASRTRPGC
ncbi:MAG TPA: hypothetical protein VL049_15615 [Candidatus Dormibacteraeota bacterium]|nr:hypothetical protein [Candidatus Dormibacteraeota bacterium]